MAEQYLTEREASDHTRLSMKTLQKWRSLGMGPPFVKQGARVVYRASDLEAWLASRTVTPTPHVDR